MINTETKTILEVPLDDWDESVHAIISEKPFRLLSMECLCGELMNSFSKKCHRKPCSANSVGGFRYHRDASSLISDPRNALERVWFHATVDPNWEVQLETLNLPIHVGFESTARFVGNEYRDVTGGYWLYQVKMKPNSRISEHFCPDLCMKWSSQLEDFTKLSQTDFTGYVNQYETIGDVSFVGNPRMLAVINKQWVPLVPMEESISMIRELLEGEQGSQKSYFIQQVKNLLQSLLELEEIVEVAT